MSTFFHRMTRFDAALTSLGRLRRSSASMSGQLVFLLALAKIACDIVEPVAIPKGSSSYLFDEKWEDLSPNQHTRHLPILVSGRVSLAWI